MNCAFPAPGSACSCAARFRISPRFRFCGSGRESVLCAGQTSRLGRMLMLQVDFPPPRTRRLQERRIMRRRFQAGSLRKTPDGYWRAFYREYSPEGARQKAKILGRIDKVTKAQAKEKLADILRTVNQVQVGPDVTVKAFVENVFYAVKKREWKASTKQTTPDRIDGHIVKVFGHRELRSLQREELQDFLDDRKHLSFSTVDHLRWDL